MRLTTKARMGRGCEVYPPPPEHAAPRDRSILSELTYSCACGSRVSHMTRESPVESSVRA